MKATILDGAVGPRDLADAVLAALTHRLAALGYEVARHDLASLRVPDCNGDFGCWTVTPGVCVQPGPHRDVARAVIQSDLVVWLTPVTFGGCSSALKRHLDHCIPLVSPWFGKIDGESHHPPRYPRAPDLLAVGLLDVAAPSLEAVFARLVRRNVLNFHAPRFASPIVTRADLPRLASLAGRWLDDLAASRRPAVRAEPLDLSPRADLPALAPRRALLLVGSPRGAASVSAAFAGHLGRLLAERGLEVATEDLHRCARQDPALPRVAAAFHEADVVALAAPVYVDSLPAPTLAALERLAEVRPADQGARPRFLAIVNCGFPEAVQCDVALAICRSFATEAGADWIGGLAFGGGGMLGGRKPLSERGGRARNAVRALAAAAEAISRGAVIPEESQRLARTLAIPAWLYRYLGDRGFRHEAKRRGTLARMGDRPYAP
jgi:NAD(P)H-dependent FMN reductase